MRSSTTVHPRVILVLACSVLFIDSSAFGIVLPFLPERARAMGGSPFDIALVFASYTGALLVATIPSGIISDRWGRRRIIVAGGLGMAISTVAFTFSDSLETLALTRFAQGVFGAMWWAPSLALVADVSPPEQRGAKMGIAMGVTGVGSLLAPPVSGVLTQWISFRLPLLLVAAGCLVTAALFWWYTRGLQSRGAGKSGASVWRTLRRPVVVLVCGTAFLITIAIGMLEPLMPLHLSDEFGAGPAAIGLVFGTSVAGWTAGSIVVGRLSDRVGRRGPFLFGVVGTAVTTPLTVLLGDIRLVALVMFFLGLAQGSMEATGFPLLADEVEGGGDEPGAQFGAVYGAFDTSFAMAGFVGPLIGGALLEVVSLDVVLGGYGILLLVYAPFLWVKLVEPRRGRRLAPEPTVVPLDRSQGVSGIDDGTL